MEYILSISLALLFLGQAHTKECKDRAPLGMNTGQIGKDQLSASSNMASFSNTHLLIRYLPFEGVLGSINSWCSSVTEEKWKDAYFEVNLKNLTTINGIALQGNVSVENLFNKYQIQFKKEESSNVWHISNEEIVGQRRGIAYNWFKQSIKATAIRVYAISRMGPQNDYAAFCLRMELFGCLKPGQQLLPLGMETGIIQDNQITSNGKSPYNGRLRNRKPGAVKYMLDSPPLSIKIDVKQAMKVTSFSSQGCLWNRKFDCLLSRPAHFQVKATNKSEGIRRANEVVNMYEVELNITSDQSTAVLNTLPTSFVGRILTFVGTKGLLEYSTIKLEVYGEHPVCSEVLPYIKPKELRTEPYINSPKDVCKNDWLKIDFEDPTVISGIVLQGKSDSDNWVESFKFNYILASGEEKSETYKGNIGRSYPLAVNWLPELAIVKSVLIKPISCKNSGCCFRFNIMGCKKVLSSPYEVKLNEINDIKQLSWKSPKIAPTNVDTYTVSMKIINPFQGGVINILQNTTSTMLILPSVGNGYKVSANITAHTKEHTSTIHKTFFVQPKIPGQPSVNLTSAFNGIQDVKSIQFHTSEKNGPISSYRVTFSKRSLSADEIDKSTNSSAKYYNTGPNFTMIVKEGSTFVPGIIRKLDTYANYTVYVRAVILRQEVSKFGFEDRDYIGEIAEFKLERKALPMLSQTSLVDGRIKINLVKGPPGSRLYQIIVMPLKKNHSMSNTRLYQNITPYHENATNSIYVTAGFNASKFKVYKEFIIGDGKIYSFYKSNKKRNVTCMNVKLDQDFSYAVFQRVYVDGLMISSPWLLVYPKEESNRLPVKFIVSIGVGSVLVLFIILLTAFCICKRHCRKSTQKEENTSEIQGKEENLYENIGEFTGKKGDDYEIPDTDGNERYATKMSLGKKDVNFTSCYIYAEDRCEFDEDNFGYEVEEESCYEIIS